jgi:hypothetical protein
LSLVRYSDGEEYPTTVSGSKTTTEPNRFVYLRATIVNQTRKSRLLLVMLRGTE